MNTTRTLGRDGLVAAISATFFLLAGATGAWAGPAPLGPEPGSGGNAPAGGIDSSGTSGWELATVGAVSAAVAVLLTLIVMYAKAHRHGARTVHA